MTNAFRPSVAALLVALLPSAVAAQDTPVVTAQAATTADLAVATSDTDAANTASPVAEATGIVDAADTSLDDLLWVNRPVIVFADSAADPRFVQQMQFIEARLDALRERDVVVITDTDPAASSDVRRQLRARGFMLVIMAKDGSIVTRKPAPWDVREISRSIDKLPLRKQEVRDRGATLRE